MAEPQFSVGIDLGTSNCAVAFARLGGPRAVVADFPILQLQREGVVGEAPLFPSALFHPPGESAGLASLALPWGSQTAWVAGQLARARGSRVPGRLVTSAKSWLCHPAVDHAAPILPWGGVPDVPKISPVQASALLLGHLRAAWNYRQPEAPLEKQDVVITVPASFDEVARGLTVKAAQESGLEQFTLLEEPQAAFYHFSHRHEANLAAELAEVRLVLVVDIGGGTTDFTLVRVQAGEHGPLFKRVAVGDHLMLGGDNMDNALARRIEEKLSRQRLSPGQWAQLAQGAREAKELLLGPAPPAEAKISLVSEGSQLLGGTLSATLSRDEAELLVLDGFLPLTPADVLPRKAARSGIQELGLPYVPEPAISRHLAAFLQKHAASGFEALAEEPAPGGVPRPDAVLLNGGVFNSRRIAGRLLEILSSWWPGRPPVRLLDHENLDLAVARGAAWYGVVRRGQGRRISGGTARSFYLGLAPTKEEPSTRAICLIPRGTEEGESIDLKDRVFKLQIGSPVQFPVYTSTGDQIDRAGDVVPLAAEFSPLPPIQTVLRSGRRRTEKTAVFLRGRLSEIGTIELSCVAVEGGERWALEFAARQEPPEGVSVTEALPKRFEEARECVSRVFGTRPGASAKEAADVKQLWAGLERLLGPREAWTLPVLRQLWSALWAGAQRRRRSPEHERIFFQLLGFCLRPGFGDALDRWRCEQSFGLFADLVEFHAQKPNWHEFWILWRRISGGLGAAEQGVFWNFAKPHLAARLSAQGSKASREGLARPKGIQPEGIEELLRAAAALEQLPAPEKKWLGDLVCARLEEFGPAGGPWAWSLGRLGARVPLSGSVHHVLDPVEVAPWIDRLAALPKLDGAFFALAQIGRKTGDRRRDLDDAQRLKILSCLRAGISLGSGESKGLESWIRLVTEAAELKPAEEARFVGDSLPIGLQLARSREQLEQAG